MRRAILSFCSAALFALLITPKAPQKLCSGFLPANDMKIPAAPACAASAKMVCAARVSAQGVSEDKFNEVLDRIEALYGPEIAARGGRLEINRLWDDPTVNSSANRDGNRYVLNMYGGLARHDSITQDGFALVACHELAHHIGGAPKISGEWATNEGQSDYYAALKCLRRVFTDDGSKSFTRKSGSDPVAEKACAAQYSSASERALCARITMAGSSVTGLFQALHHESKAPRFDTPDPAVVSQTDDDHPATQCRLDTYFQGSLCTQPVSKKVSDKNPATGTCTRSQGFEVGLRPLCWYKPPASERQLEIARFGAPASSVKESLSKSAAFSQLDGASLWR